MNGFRFRDRHHAGQVLAGELTHLSRDADLVVLALPRGGVPVGSEIARALGAPLDVFIVRKLGVPGHEELAMGAIASGGARVLNDDVLDMVHVPPDLIERVTEREMHELARRERAYRGDRPPVALEGRTVVVVDDGLATGSTMRAAVLALRAHRPRKIVVAVPVAARETCELLARSGVDEVVCARMPDPFHAVSLWYENFEQTSDQEVGALLAATAEEQNTAPREQ